jgi:hypothetical protein
MYYVVFGVLDSCILVFLVSLFAAHVLKYELVMLLSRTQPIKWVLGGINRSPPRTHLIGWARDKLC